MRIVKKVCFSGVPPDYTAASDLRLSTAAKNIVLIFRIFPFDRH